MVVVCTGNIARSPALAMHLQFLRPDLTVRSAAVGLKAKPGLRIPKPLRELLAGDGFGELADAHRSVLLADVGFAPIMVATAKIHYKRLVDAGMEAAGVTKFVHQLEIPDPVWEGPGGYAKVYPQIVKEARELAEGITR